MILPSKEPAMRRPAHVVIMQEHQALAAMLRSLGEEEARAAAEATGQVEIRCEFCGRHYDFPLTEFGVLFAVTQAEPTSSERLH